MEQTVISRLAKAIDYPDEVPDGASSVKFKVASKEYDSGTGKGFRPVIGVHKGSSLDALAQIAYASDDGSVGMAAVEFDALTPGEDYRIRISGWRTTRGRMRR